MSSRAKPVKIEPGQKIERKLAEGETHPYLIEVKAGEYFRVTAEQKGVDLALRLFTPGGEMVADIDSPTGSRGFERVSEIAAVAGVYRVEVVGMKGTQPGDYEIHYVEHRVAEKVTEADRQRVAGERVFQEGETLRRDKKLEEAIAVYERALGLFKQGEDRDGEADALHRLGWMHQRLDRWEKAVDLCTQAAELYGQAGDSTGRAQALNRSGRLLIFLGRSEEARAPLEEAVRLFRATSDPEGEAPALTNLGNVHNRGGRFDEALEAYDQVLPLARRIGSRRDEGIALMGRGDLYLEHGQWDAARGDFESALRSAEELGDQELAANALDYLGAVDYRQGRLAESRQESEKALALYRELGDRRNQAIVLSSLGAVLLKTGDGDGARKYYEQALALFRDLGDAQGEAMTTSHLGRVALAQGDARRAVEIQKEALTHFERLKDRPGLSLAHYGMAQALLALGDPEGALWEGEASLDVAEAQRTSAQSLDVRAFYFATRQHYAELNLQILLSLERLHPGKGFAERALEADERRRARSLLDALARVRSVPQQRTETFSLAEIRQRLLDSDTLLLIYSLGEERSVLWKVTRSKLTTHELPERRRIETAAWLAHDLLSHRTRVKSQLREKALSDLAALLLDPVAGDLPKYRRLLIVPDGALQRIPFGALPDPGASPVAGRRPLLIEGHPIIYLPSASVGVTLRQERRTGPMRQRSGPLVAVLADPVFDASDSRVSRKGGDPESAAETRGGALSRAARTLGVDRFERLLFSGEEARAIQELRRHRDDVLSVVDFAANRDVLNDERWRRAPILHFATHGLLNDRQPELSGLVLSQVHPDGTQRPDGFLRLEDIYGLTLDADLVVLSACQTGAGKELRGEGLLGLTRGFMSLGVPQLVVSLWKVEDEATKELMTRFYRELFQGYRPPEALQRAQKSMLGDPAWGDPALWAGFIFLGDFERRPGGIETRDTGGSDTPRRADTAGLPPPKVKPKPPKKDWDL